MIVDVLLLVLGYFVVSGPLFYMASTVKSKAGDALASIIWFLKAAFKIFIFLVVASSIIKVYKKSSESESELEPTYSSNGIKAVELWKIHLSAIFITLLLAKRFCPTLLKWLSFALFTIFILGLVLKINRE